MLSNQENTTTEILDIQTINLINSEFEEIIDFAIENEKKTHKHLINLSKKVKNKLAKTLLTSIACDEMYHVDELESIVEMNPNEFQVYNFKYSSYFNEDDYIYELPINPTMQETLLYIIGQKHAKFLLYKDLAKSSDSIESKDTFVKLSRLELTHIKDLEKWYREICLH